MNDLLVVDWSYFFGNPLENADVDDETVLLYDWSHAETRFHIEEAWDDRAAGFLAHGLDLPYCTGYEDFWSRFDLAEQPWLLVADSAAHAGHYERSPDSVWAFSAYHGCGYPRTRSQWRASGLVTCRTVRRG